MASSLEDALSVLQDLYAQIEGLITPIQELHGQRLHCAKGCIQCCQDDLSVFQVEADNIRHHNSDLLRDEHPHAPGACAFLDTEGACRIYEHRPYVCRTQGLPLRWLEEQEDGVVVEYRDICPLNAEGTPIEELPPEQCWPLGPAEEALAELQERVFPGQMTRVSLRDLFSQS